MQRCASGHCTPQPPQCTALVAVVTQKPPQNAWPAGHWHVPPVQLWPAGHTTPHAPQFTRSVAVATQTPPQTD
jgi:hypothetical protein